MKSFALAIIVCCIGQVAPVTWPMKRKCLVDGDLIIGSFFPIHGSHNVRVCGRLQDEGLIQLESLLFTVDNVNRASNLLPGIKLGVLAMDSCDSVPYSLEEAVDLAKGFIVRDNIRGNDNRSSLFHCEGSATPVYESGLYNRVVAIVGGHSSWVSMQVADLLRIYRVPQISYQSTNPSLSDKTRYEYFFRTVPPLEYQVKAILEILKSFEWGYVSVVYADSSYGNGGFQVLKKQAPLLSICFSSAQRVNVENSKDEDYDFVLSNLLRRNATVVVLLGDKDMARNLVAAASRADANDRFVWLGGTTWVNRDFVTTGLERTLEGAIGIVHEIKPLKNFDIYLKTRKLEDHRKINPWFDEFWEEKLRCRLHFNNLTTPFNEDYVRYCSSDDKLQLEDYMKSAPSVQFVRDAVYAVVHALRDMQTKKCKTRSGLCKAMREVDGEELREYLRNVEFEDENKNTFRFDANGDGPPRYTIVNFQKKRGSGEYAWVPVGSYTYVDESNSEVDLHKELMKYKTETPSFPASICSSRCSSGQAMIALDDAKCCWYCRNCTAYQFVKDGSECQNCELGKKSNLDKTRCINIPLAYMNLQNPWAIGCITFSIVGVMMTLAVGVMLWKLWDTPIFVVSGRELSLIMLTGILLSFLVPFAILAKPTNASCGAVRFLSGFCYCMCYAAVVAKTHRLVRMSELKAANKKSKLVPPKSLLFIATALFTVESSINATWLLHTPPSTKHYYPTRTQNILICKESDSADYLVGLLYPFVLVVFSTAYALKVSQFRDAFYESRYINFTNYTTFVLWLAFLPMYLLNNNNVLRAVILSLLLSVSALVQLVCLFFPKVYIALRRPEKNIPENVVAQEIKPVVQPYRR